MDRTADYTICFSFPFNKKTSYIYSDDPILRKSNLDHAVETIQLIISAHGFISMETVMKTFEFRPTRHCPGINFTEFEEYELTRDEINHTDVLNIWMSNEMRLRPLIRFNENQEIEKEEQTECQTGQKETSESEEKEKT